MKTLTLTTKLAILSALLLMAVGSARADLILTLNVANSGVPDPGPYGTVDVHLTDSTHATVTYTAAGSFSFVDSGIVGVEVNASSFTVGSLSGFSSSASVGSGNEDGFGNFNVSIDNGAASVHETSLSFVLTDTSGSWASASSVLTGNASGYDAAAHVFYPLGNNGNGSTGYVVNGTPTVPDGASTAMLLGIASLGVGMLKRRLVK